MCCNVSIYKELSGVYYAIIIGIVVDKGFSRCFADVRPTAKITSWQQLRTAEKAPMGNFDSEPRTNKGRHKKDTMSRCRPNDAETMMLLPWNTHVFISLLLFIDYTKAMSGSWPLSPR